VRHVQVFWKTVQEPGFEHLSLALGARGTVADGLVLGVSGEPPEPFRLRYRIECDQGLAVRSLVATVERATERRIALRTGADGVWYDADAGARLAHLEGCTALDVMTSPFTNTLPVRMRTWTPGDRHELDVAYVTVPALGVARDRQRYTCLVRRDDAARFRVESLDAGWAYELDVDRDGLVVDYADLFARVGTFVVEPREPP